jgi:hypothetical protein
LDEQCRPVPDMSRDLVVAATSGCQWRVRGAMLTLGCACVRVSVGLLSRPHPDGGGGGGAGVLLSSASQLRARHAEAPDSSLAMVGMVVVAICVIGGAVFFLM